MDQYEQVASSRLATLQADVNAGNETALDAFWQAVATDGTPLIEAIEGEDRNVLLTLLWRHAVDIRNVMVVGGLAGADMVGNQMLRLQGTDVWYLTRKVRDDLRTTYQIAPNDPMTPLFEVTSWVEWLQRTAHWMPDPLNPHRFVHPKTPEEPDSTERVESVIELLGAPRHPWIEPHSEVPSGKVEFHPIQSVILDDVYHIWVYIPPDYTAEHAPYDLLVLFDGRDHLDLIPTPTTLDNLLADEAIPPTVAVLVESPRMEARMRDLSCSPPFVEFLTDELIPWVRENYHVTVHSEQTTVGGVSLGGLTAAFAAFKHPEIFGKVLSQSGAFAWRPEGDPEHEWLSRQFASEPSMSLRVYLNVGLLEADSLPNDAPSQLVSNRHMRDVLQAKEYQFRYVEYNGAHDYISWRGLLGDGLMWLGEGD